MDGLVKGNEDPGYEGVNIGDLKKLAAFSLRLDLAMEVNRHFLENEYGDLSFFFCCFELSSKFL